MTGYKYTDLQALHNQNRAAQVKKPQQTRAATQNRGSPSALASDDKPSLQTVAQVLTKEGVTRNFSKSSAQVESWVLPRAVLPNSGELKLKNITCKKKKGTTTSKRPSPLSVRLSECQKETVRAKAREAAMPVNAFVKYALLGTDYDPNLRNLLHKTYCELTRQGINLNQIAKKLNSGMATPSQGIAVLEAIREPLIRTLRTVGNALTRGQPMP
jgi:hypothetical protein